MAFSPYNPNNQRRRKVHGKRDSRAGAYLYTQL